MPGWIDPKIWMVIGSGPQPSVEADLDLVACSPDDRGDRLPDRPFFRVPTRKKRGL